MKTILLKSLSGVEISKNEGTILFKAENIDDKNAIFDTATSCAGGLIKGRLHL